MLKRTKLKKEVNIKDTELLNTFRLEYLKELHNNLADQKKLMEMKYEKKKFNFILI